MKSRFGWALAGALLLGFILVLARTATAGSLDPPGPVGSTMRTLDELLPSWNKTLTASGGCDSQRFDCVMSDQAVLDRETGLVWDRTPNGGFLSYEEAHIDCTYNAIGGRYGWRLPTINELWSLADDSADDNLPDGNPFVDAGGGVYWSTTTAGRNDDLVKTLAFFGGFLEELDKPRFEADISNAWCVRGGLGGGDETLVGEAPSWSRLLSTLGSCNSQRFQCVMGAAAVLDRETGLVWERTPDIASTYWIAASLECLRYTSTGNRNGWRLPTAAELYSLWAFGFPGGHPFNVAGADVFWTADLYDPLSANPAYHVVDFTLPTNTNYKFPGEGAQVWCVRGPE